jgi:hypothetical protein
MTSIELAGIDGSNPLGFLASLGLLRIIAGARLAFSQDGSFHAILDGFDGSEADLTKRIHADAQAAADQTAPWRFQYQKPATRNTEAKTVADLKPSPEYFKPFLARSIEHWLAGNDEMAAYAAAYATDIAVDGNGNTKPTAFHFTAAQQTFLGAVESIRSSVTEEWVQTSLFNNQAQPLPGLAQPETEQGRRTSRSRENEAAGRERPGNNLRWDPNAERNWALMSGNPTGEETRVNAPLEWLAFRGLPLLPSLPAGSKEITTTCVYGRGADRTFAWPLWSVSASLSTVRSILLVNWTRDRKDRAARGIFAICQSKIRRTGQGFGNFGPASLTS